ncbi:hypothetical protein E3N88_07962 [Mikania micrantha]|uniref:PORR domain-containing protein n=1 Tax=Mikania micrantha TaxID=192012 RepID=A0A5N6PFX9_9ASTR|nr:hypothetical protein E3N88_07962 [Mikania micrantha]
MFRMILGYGKNHQYASKHPYELGFRHNQRYSLVNVKLKWVKDRVLDTVVTGERELRAAWVIMSMIAVDPGGCLPIYRLSGRQRGPLGLPQDLKPKKLAVSQLETSAILQQKRGFCVGFPRGFGLKRKSIEWLDEWQRLPYTSPYVDSSHLDPRTDVSEKRIVGVFHELLHLTIQKKTERQNVSNLRKPLNLPEKFTKVFERHPGIFYISKKNNTLAAVLREAYDGGRLVHRHPVSKIRNKFASLLKEGILGRSQGLYKKLVAVNSGGKDELYQVYEAESCENKFESEEESKDHMFSEYKYDETTRLF